MGPRIYSTKHMIEQSMVPDKEDSATVHHEESCLPQPVRQIRWGIQPPAGVHCSRPQIPHSTSSRGRSAPGCVPQAEGESCASAQPDTFPVEETDEGGAGTSAPKPAAEQPADQAAEAELQQPPPKKTALEHLLEGTFTEPAGAAQLNHMSGFEAEIVRYRSETPISLTSCPHKWWKENGKMYPLLSPLAKAYLTTPATSVPIERVFFQPQGAL